MTKAKANAKGNPKGYAPKRGDRLVNGVWVLAETPETPETTVDAILAAELPAPGRNTRKARPAMTGGEMRDYIRARAGLPKLQAKQKVKVNNE